MDELAVESEKWEACAYFRLKTEQAACPAWMPSFPRNYDSNKYELVEMIMIDVVVKEGYLLLS